jgi:hypothetical protein
VELKTPRAPVSAANAAPNLPKQTNNRSLTLNFFFYSRKGNAIADENYEKLVDSDFDNFDKLYEKCPALQLEIEKKITPSLRSAQISGFTPNTGGICLPFVTLETHDNEPLIDRTSVGVTFTPVDIRIGPQIRRHLCEKCFASTVFKTSLICLKLIQCYASFVV